MPEEETAAEEMDPHVPSDLLDLFVQLDEEGLSPEEFKEAMS
jgi:hypothetical protein